MFGKLIRLPLRLIPPDTIVAVLFGPLRGMRWVVGSSVHGCWVGSYERNKQRAFYNAVGPQDVVWDIGANVGFYTLLAHRARTVYAFEPAEENVRDLRRHLQLNGIRNAAVFQFALAAHDGTALMYTRIGRAQHLLHPNGNVSVPTRTIDSLVRDGTLEPPTIIKMDIEGAEVDCLRGGESTIKKWRPRMFIATHWQATEPCLALLKEWGFDPKPIGQEHSAEYEC